VVVVFDVDLDVLNVVVVPREVLNVVVVLREVLNVVVVFREVLKYVILEVLRATLVFRVDTPVLEIA